MKKHCINLLLLLLASFNSYAQNCLVEPVQRFRYTMPIAGTGTADSSNNWFLMKAESDFDYGKFLASNIENGKLSVFQPINASPYTIDLVALPLRDFKANLGGSTDSLYLWDDSLQKEKLYVITKEMETNGIKSLTFYEDWSYDSTRFTFSKKVVAIDAIRTYYRNEDVDSIRPIEKPVFRIANQNNSKMEKLQEYRTVEYGFVYTPDTQCDQYPQFTLYTWNVLVSSIISKVVSGKVPAFDATTRKPLSKEKANELFSSLDTVSYMSEDDVPVVSVVEKTIDKSEIKSIVFSERWQVNVSTGMIKKTIVGASLIRHIEEYNPETESMETKKIPMFYVKFN